MRETFKIFGVRLLLCLLGVFFLALLALIGWFAIKGSIYFLYSAALSPEHMAQFQITLSPFDIGAALLLFILSVGLLVLFIRRGFSPYLLVPSLILNLVVFLIFFLFLLSPTLDYFLLRVIFQKGFCDFLITTSEELAPEDKVQIDEFCDVNSSVLNIDTK
jgi:hypothetical protein